MIKGEHFIIPNELDQGRKEEANKRAEEMKQKRISKHRNHIQNGTYQTKTKTTK